jgi:NADPH2:quinone reductase
MRAIVVDTYGEPEVMHVKEISGPEPGPGQVLVNIRAAGVNPADAVIRAGSFPAGPKPPYTPGWDGAGEIEAVGEGITRFKPGDRVYMTASLSGTYASQALCTQAQVHHLPESISFTQGAAIGLPYPTAYAALFLRARALPAETVLVHGASGGVGIAAVQLARAAGLEVFGTASSPHGKQLVAVQGARVLDHKDPNYLDELMSLTKNRGVDIIIEMLANKNLARDLGVLAPRGRVVIVGSHGQTTIEPLDLVMRDAAVLGLLLPNATPGEEAQIHAALTAGFVNGALRPVVFKEYPLTQASVAHHEIMDSHVAGKIVLVP